MFKLVKRIGFLWGGSANMIGLQRRARRYPPPSPLYITSQKVYFATYTIMETSFPSLIFDENRSFALCLLVLK